MTERKETMNIRIFRGTMIRRDKFAVRALDLCAILLALSVVTAAAQIPSTLGWYQIPNTTMPPCPTGFSNCQNVVGSWSGGIADIKRNRLLYWGGGHADYPGNEIYSLDLNALTMTRLNNPSPAQDCVETLSDGKPNARHTYGGIAYDSATDTVFMHGGALECSNGTNIASVATWALNPASLQWTRQDPTKGAQVTQDCCNYINFSSYDPATGRIYFFDDGNFWKYDLVTNALANIGNAYGVDYHVNAVIDEGRHLFLMFGAGQAWSGNIGGGGPTTFTNISSQVSGCGAMQSADYPGLAFDPVQQRIVGWAGGNSVYVYNPDTLSCTTVTYPNGPGAQQVTGTFGRFRYFPALNIFALVNDAAQNAYALRLTPAPPPPPGGSADADFAARCAAPGVIVCQGFDDPAGIPHATYPNSGALPANNGTSYPTQDKSIVASGAGSLRFDIPTPSGSANPDGYWRQLIQADLNAGPATAQLFGQNSTFYVQYRQRMTSAYITNAWGGNTWFKQSIIATDNSTCGQQELTTVNSYSAGHPEMYSACGADPFYDTVGPTIYIEQGDVKYTTGYNCAYPYPGSGNCFHYQPDTWMTFTYKVHIGIWGQANSSIEAWVTVNGEPYTGRQFVNMQNHVLNQDGGSVPNGYNAVYLTPYWTGNYSGASGPATTWYDELIVSAQPIAAPGGSAPPPDTTPPTVPTNLAAVAASSSQINLSWNASTDNVGVMGYKVFRCQGAGCAPGAQVGTTGSTSYLDSGLSASTAYAYNISAFDAAGNVSALSASASAVTLSSSNPPPTPPPADAKPGLRDTLVFPNPAVSRNPTIRTFLGQVSSVEITIFDAAGGVVDSASLGGSPTGISNGQYYYDYIWSGKRTSGIYFAVIHGKAADGSIVRARTKFAVVR